jgi:hypothetical protein
MHLSRFIIVAHSNELRMSEMIGLRLILHLFVDWHALQADTDFAVNRVWQAAKS